MAIHPDFPSSPHAILAPEVRWFPADEALRESSYEKLLPPLVHTLRRKVMAWRVAGYEGASGTSISLLNWWFAQEHLISRAGGGSQPFQYYFAQREAVETIIYLYDAIRVKDKYDLIPYISHL
jgi:type III restriction enzyme